MATKRRLNQQLVTEAAIELAETSGMDAVTIASLSKKLNIRPPSLYNHISGLAEVKTLIAIYSLEQLSYTLTKAVAGISGDAAVYAIGDAYVSFCRKHWGIYESTVRAREQEHTRLKQASEELVALVMKVLEMYHLSEKEKIHAVRGLRSYLHGFVSIEQQHGFGLAVSLDESFHYGLTIFIEGLRKK